MNMGYSQLPNNPEKTQNIPSRLTTRILEQLELEAGQSNVPDNVLVKQILTNYVNWTRLSNGIELLPITKDSFKKLAQNHDLGINFLLIMEELFKRVFAKFIHDDKIRFKTSNDSIVASVILDSDFSENTIRKRV
jgi:hypothetical protein